MCISKESTGTNTCFTSQNTGLKNEENTKGFESFVTKSVYKEEINQFFMICSREGCTSVECDTPYTRNCLCPYQWYCSRECEDNDSSHKCDSERPGTVSVTSERVQARIITGKYKTILDVGSYFTGMKRGKKYIRGRFQIQLHQGQHFAYLGQVTTVKINGVVTIVPDGKGVLVSGCRRHMGTFVMGKRHGYGCTKTISGVSTKGQWEDDCIKGVHETERDGYVAFACTHETVMQDICTSRDVHDSWKSTKDTVCMERKGMFGKFKPVVMKKTQLDNRFEHCRVVGVETVGKVKFRRRVHWSGEHGPIIHCTDGPVISFSSNNTCSAHGQWSYGSVCPSMTEIPTDDISMGCTCRKGRRVDTCPSEIFVNSIPAPMDLPKIKRCKGGRSNKIKKHIHVDKDISIRGVSKRDMSKDVRDISGDLDTILEEGGWGLKNRKNHFKFSRVINGKKQNFVCSKTPSDKRSRKNDLSVMKNLSRRL